MTRGAGWLFALSVLVVTASGCVQVAEQAPAEMLAPDPVDPSGAWLQTREPLLDVLGRELLGVDVLDVDADLGLGGEAPVHERLV